MSRRLPPGIDKRAGGYRARFRNDAGRQVQKTFPTLAEARAWLDEQRAAVRRGDWIDPEAGKVTFAAYAAEWLDQQHHMRPTTKAQAGSRLRLHVYPVIGDMHLSRIRRSHVQKVVTTASATLAPSTVRVVHAYVTSVLTSAVRDRLIASSPAIGISLPQQAKTKVVPLTTAQVATLAENVPDHLSALVWLGVATGLRSGELRALTADRLSPPLHLVGDVPPAVVTVRVDRSLSDSGEFGPVKTPSADREVPIGQATARILVEHLRAHGLGPDGLVFHDHGRPILRGQAGRVWKDATKEMGLPERSGWHLLRHTHASMLLSDGVSIAAVSARLGHSSPVETLSTYSHMMPSDEDRIIAASDRAVI